MLRLQLRTATRQDLEQLKLQWSRPELLSLGGNLVFLALVYLWLWDPLDARQYHQLALVAGLAMLYSRSSHQEARVTALKQIKDALVQFVRIENATFHRARKYRNLLAKEFNELQQAVDGQRGIFYRYTSFLRQERLWRDTSALESLAVGTSSALGSVLSDNLADLVIKTRGFGPIVFVCLPRGVQSASDLLTPKKDHVVYGVFAFGRLITRFNAVTTVLALFPDTLESERLVAMRQDARRLRSLIYQKEHELHALITKNFAPLAAGPPPSTAAAASTAAVKKPIPGLVGAASPGPGKTCA